ncbi:c-type cytochrome [Vibrio sonorensis]|uniref:c-type cytochrome n=1 Tax=Vibrio sonorensis TaxID=1004316 RepID=UPI0008DAD85F|nr:c-type cytochrome [Vibrio sonorensis]
MAKSILLLTTLLFISLSVQAQGDPELGKIKTPSCGFCHSPAAYSNNPSYPKIEGQDANYLFMAMKSYQNDERKGALAAMMKAQLQHLDDADLRDVAAYYSQKENR